MVYRFTSGIIFFFFNLVLRHTHTERERTSAKVSISVGKIRIFLKEVRLIQNHAAASDATPQSVLRSAKGSLWNLRLPSKGKFREVLEDHPGLLTALTKHNCWRTYVLMHLHLMIRNSAGCSCFSPLSHFASENQGSP